MRRTLARLLLAPPAALGLLLAGPVPAHATDTGSAPAATPGGVDETLVFGRELVVPQPYTPDPTDHAGPHRCLQKYHDYSPTPGCGGFTVDVTLHNVRSQPGFVAGANDGSDIKFTATADTDRTFGCRTADGTFDWSTAFVVRTTRTPLDHVYFSADSGWIVDQTRRATDGSDYGPSFSLNFPAVKADCPAGTTPVQYGLKVTDLDIGISGSAVFGTTSWHHDGPFYG